MEVKDLKNQKTYLQRVYDIFRKNKKKAFRPIDVIEKTKFNENTVRDSIHELYNRGLLNRKTVSQIEVWYYYAGK